MSEETFDTGAAIEGMARVEEFNDQFRRPNPRGKYPLCKPILNNAGYCGYCRNPITGNYPCPAVPPEKRWGEDRDELRRDGFDTLRQSHEVDKV